MHCDGACLLPPSWMHSDTAELIYSLIFDQLKAQELDVVPPASLRVHHLSVTDSVGRCAGASEESEPRPAK